MCLSGKTLFCTDADLGVRIFIYAFVNERREFVIKYCFEDDGASSMNFKKVAVVDREDTLQISRFLNVKIEELTQLLYDECGIDYESTPSHGDAVFRDALDFILDAGAGYKFKETR